MLAALQAMAGIAVLSVSFETARLHKRSTGLASRLLSLYMAAMGSILLLGALASHAPMVVATGHSVTTLAPGLVSITWAGFKPAYTRGCERVGEPVVFLRDAAGQWHAAPDVAFSADTGAVTRPAGQQSFGTWTVAHPPQLQPIAAEIRTVHACWFSLQFVPTNLGPWKIQ